MGYFCAHFVLSLMMQAVPPQSIYEVNEWGVFNNTGSGGLEPNLPQQNLLFLFRMIYCLSYVSNYSDCVLSVFNSTSVSLAAQYCSWSQARFGLGLILDWIPHSTSHHVAGLVTQSLTQSCYCGKKIVRILKCFYVSRCVFPNFFFKSINHIFPGRREQVPESSCGRVENNKDQELSCSPTFLYNLLFQPWWKCLPLYVYILLSQLKDTEESHIHISVNRT